MPERSLQALPSRAHSFKAVCCSQGCPFHRIQSGFCCQGGDIVRHDGSSGDSIFGRTFNDERGGLKLPHDRAGVLSMANSGKNSNSSQFFFTLAPASQCDGALLMCLSGLCGSVAAASLLCRSEHNTRILVPAVAHEELVKRLTCASPRL